MNASAPPSPEPLPGEAFDSHCHLDMVQQPVPEVLAAARAVGIRRVVTIGIDVPSSQWAADCAANNDDVHAAVAIHPNDTTGTDDGAFGQIAALAKLPQVRAIGETGLDYYRDSADPRDQQRSFRAHIEIAKQSGKALVIHDRQAHDDVLRILDEEGPPEKVVFHCFSGDEHMARICGAKGYVMSFAGNVTFSSAQPLRDAAHAAPMDLIMVETDAPFLTPVPHRGKPNAPCLVPYTVRCIAGVKDVDVAELCAAISSTGERVFGPW